MLAHHHICQAEPVNSEYFSDSYYDRIVAFEIL